MIKPTKKKEHTKETDKSVKPETTSPAVKHGKGAQKKKRPKAVTIAMAVILVILLAVLAVLVFVGSKLNKINYSDGVVTGGDTEENLTEEERIEDTLNVSGLETWDEPLLADAEVIFSDDVFNILLLGTDDRTLEFSDNARADSIILFSLNFKEQTGKLVSLERGMGVPILDGQYKGQYDWITHCFRYGGASLMLQEVQTCFSVDVQHYVRVNLNALLKIIDILGGIDVELTEKEAWYLNQSALGATNFGSYKPGTIYTGDSDSELQSNLVTGMNHLSGATALAYARLRAIDSDWHRIERQRTVIQACANQLKNADLLTLNKLADEILPLVQTNLSQKEILELMVKAPGMLGITFDQMTIPAQGTYGGMTGMDGRGMFAPNFAENIRLLQEFLYGETTVEEPAA